MNTTSRALLQTVLSTDAALTDAERAAFQFALKGESAPESAQPDEVLLVTQKAAARMLSVSRVTVWRLTKDRVLHPVEILPGTWRYAYAEVARLAHAGMSGLMAETNGGARRSVAA